MTNKTRSIKGAEIVKKWMIIDATGVRLGKLANKVATLLMGKHKVTHVNYLDCGDNVIIINASKVEINQTAIDQKRYYWHTGFPGGIKSRSIVDLLEKKPEYVMKEAVWGMLPKNRMGRKMLSNMRVFAGSEHNMTAQQPEVITVK